MTDPALLTTTSGAISDADTSTTATTAADDLRLRVERLQRRRATRPVAASTPPSPRSSEAPPVAGTSQPAALRHGQRGRRRRHPAIGARIGAAGFSLATMFGLVAAMGLSRTSTDAQAAAAAAAVPDRVVVVVHRITTTTPAGGERVATSGTTNTGISGPITLAARPTVRVAAQSTSPPAAHTNGSR
jgi:hypothetical protein